MHPSNFGREQRLARRLLLAIAALVIVVGVPLVVSGSLRLKLAWDIGLAPGKDVPKVVGADPNTALIAVTVDRPDDQGRPIQIALALYIATTTPTGIVLQDLNQPRTLRVPLDGYDLVSSDADASHLLFVSDPAGGEARAVLVTVASGAVNPLPAGQTAPNLPGDWTTPIWQSAAVGCDSASPGFTFVACVRGPKMAAYLAGNWEIQMMKYGDINYGFKLFRGRGSEPIGGWAKDDRTFWFQNELGIWKATVSPDELKPR